MNFEKVLKNIYPAARTHNDRDVDPSFSRNPKRNHHNGKKRVIDYTDTIKKRAEVVNEKFIRSNLPHRIRIYTKGKRAYINMSIYGDQNVIVSSTTRDITDDDFGILMDNISTGSGLLFDDMPPWKIK
jgi:hypothetical protein